MRWIVLAALAVLWSPAAEAQCIPTLYDDCSSREQDSYVRELERENRRLRALQEPSYGSPSGGSLLNERPSQPNWYGRQPLMQDQGRNNRSWNGPLLND